MGKGGGRGVGREEGVWLVGVWHAEGAGFGGRGGRGGRQPMKIKEERQLIGRCGDVGRGRGGGRRGDVRAVGEGRRVQAPVGGDVTVTSQPRWGDSAWGSPPPPPP